MFFIELHTLIVIGFALRILLRDGMLPSTRMAWFMVILTLPVAGSILYFLFGEVDIGHKAAKRQAEIFRIIRKYAARALGRPEDLDLLVDPLLRPPSKYAASINGFNVVPGNRAELMPDAKAARERLIEDIDNARDHIHVLYYIWLEDETGKSVARALARAAYRGVTCRAMVDAMGSRALIKSALWSEMRDAGVQLGVTLPFDNLIATILTSRIDLRNHRKITVIDGKITYCGSQNCADPEFRIKARYAPWVDIVMRIEGPVVAQNQMLFASDWMKEVDTPIECFPIDAPQHPDGFLAQAVGDGPTERKGASPQLFVTLIEAAQDELIITTPYFVPDATVIEALCAAVHRKVKVTLIVPRKNDSWVVSAVSKSFYKRLLEAGARIFEFNDGLLHSKTLTVDQNAVFLGSSNMDMRSFDLNYENDILIQDRESTMAVRERQIEYIAQSTPVLLSEVIEWSYVRRIWYNVVATLGPVL